MSSNYLFSIADHNDDDELRCLMNKISMPGSISLSFSREPSYFLAESIGSIKSETMICRKKDNGQIVGIGVRSLWSIYYNGERKKIWYLHSLRSLDEERNGILLLRAYRFFRSLPNDSDFPYFLTTILDENIYAKKVLENGRVGMPSYTKIGTIITHLIPLRVKRKIEDLNSRAQRCSPELLALAYSSIDDWNKNQDFAPSYSLDEIKNTGGKFPNFSFENLYVYFSNKQVIGTLGVWNQQLLKQVVVKNYSRVIRILKPFYNFYSSIIGLPLLPEKGKTINMLYASFLSASRNNVFVFESLLKKVICDWSGDKNDWLSLGVEKDSSLNRAVEKYSKRKITSSIYIVHWSEDNVIVPENVIPYLDIAFL